MGSIFDRFDLEVPFVTIRSRSATSEYLINPLAETLSDILVAPWPDIRPERSRRPPELISSIPSHAHARVRQPSRGRDRFVGRAVRYRAGQEVLELRFQGFGEGITLRYVPYIARSGRVLQRELPIEVTCASNPTPAQKWRSAFFTLPAREREAALAIDRQQRKKDHDWQSPRITRFGCEDDSGIVWAVPAELQHADPTLDVLNRSYARSALAESLVLGWMSPGLGGPFPEDEIVPNDLLPMPAGDTAAWLFRDREEFFDGSIGSAFLWDGNGWLPHV